MAGLPRPASEIGIPVNALASTINILAVPLDYILDQINDFFKIFHKPIASHLSTVAEAARPITRPITTNLELAVVQFLYELHVLGKAIWHVVTNLAFPAIDLASRKKDVIVAYLQITYLNSAPFIQIASNLVALVKETFVLGLQTVDYGISAVRFVLKIVASVAGVVDRIRDLDLSAFLVILLITIWLARETLGYSRRNRVDNGP